VYFNHREPPIKDNNMDAYIVKAYRSAVGKANKGGFRNYRSDDLAVDVIQHLLQHTPELDPKLVDDVIVGCANPEGEQGLQIGRQISMRALGKEVPGMTVNRYCASGLETISIAVAKIRAGMGQIYLAGGAETMSMIPMTGYKLAPSYQVAAATPDYLASMGLTAEAVATNTASTARTPTSSPTNRTRKRGVPSTRGNSRARSCPWR
jgi:acetyl-CoA acyltransferase